MNYEELLTQAREKVSEKESKARFTFPEAETLIQGPKTLVKNFSSICKDLRRSPEHLSRFLVKELGTSGAIERDWLRLKGNFSPERVNEKLKLYVKKFVLCKECGKPDTELKDNVIKCEACGATYSVK